MCGQLIPAWPGSTVLALGPILGAKGLLCAHSREHPRKLSMFPHKGSPHRLGAGPGAKYGWGRDHMGVKGSPLPPDTHRDVTGPVTGLRAAPDGDNPLLLGACCTQALG